MIGTLPRGVGSRLDDADLDPFWHAADETGAIIHIHPSFDAGDARVNDFGLANGLGRITDAAVAMARLISAGHVAKYKNARIFAPMGGAALPFVIGRLKRNAQITPGIGDPVEALAQIYTDTILHDARVLKFVVEIMGTNHLMMGSDMPFPIGDTEPMKIVGEAGLSKTQSDSINGGLATRLFRFNDKRKWPTPPLRTATWRRNRMSTILRSAASIVAALALTTLVILAPAAAQAPAKITIVVFGFPSLGAFMPPVIKAQKLDTANGLDIEFVERPPDAYTTQFNSGEFKVGGSAAVLTVGLADARGVKVKYLFNLFDFWGTVVTSRPEIKSVKDLEGKQLAAASSTTNFVMFEFFAKKLGMDPSKVQVVNTAPPGLVGYALADRADAIQLWEPAYTLLKAKKPSIQTLDTQINKTWTTFAGGERIPYLGVAAHSDWIEQNQAIIPKLFATYKAAADFIAKHPVEAAALIAPKSTAEDRDALVSLIKSNDRLGMNVVPAGEVAKQIDAVYKAGVDVGYFKSPPSTDTIYVKSMQ